MVPCSICRRPAAALVGGGLHGSGSNAERLICSECVRQIHEALDQHLATIDPADLGEAEDLELTIEQEYERGRPGQRRVRRAQASRARPGTPPALGGRMMTSARGQRSSTTRPLALSRQRRVHRGRAAPATTASVACRK